MRDFRGGHDGGNVQINDHQSDSRGCSMFCGARQASADLAKRPHIVIIWGDDIGQSNVSAYTNGLMGYRTPNIDSIARMA